MKSLTLQVPRSGLNLKLATHAASSAQIVLVLPDDVDVTETRISETALRAIEEHKKGELFIQAPVRALTSDTGFPPRPLTEETIVQIIREHGGSVQIRNVTTGWNIYDEIAARLGVSIEARSRLTAGTQEPAWRPEIGFCRKNLEQRRVIKPTKESGRGVWALSEK